MRGALPLLVPLGLAAAACGGPECADPPPIHLIGLNVRDGAEVDLLLDDEPLRFRCEPDGEGVADLEPADADVACGESQIVIRGSGAERIEGTVSGSDGVTELDEEIEYVPASASFGEQVGDECPLGLVDLE